MSMESLYAQAMNQPSGRVCPPPGSYRGLQMPSGLHLTWAWLPRDKAPGPGALGVLVLLGTLDSHKPGGSRSCEQDGSLGLRARVFRRFVKVSLKPRGTDAHLCRAFWGLPGPGWCSSTGTVRVSDETRGLRVQPWPSTVSRGVMCK